jgi:hypothetical protein
MADGAGREILSRLAAGRAPIIDTLAAMPEPERRRVLRPNDEAAFRANPAEAAIRAELDEALELLSLAELGAEAGCLPDTEVRGAVWTPALATLFESEAFRRYVDYYLYFGIRLLAGRLKNLAEQSPREAGESTGRRTEGRDCNVVPLALDPPPLPEGAYAGAEEQIQRFIESADAARDATADTPADIKSALDFLDGGGIPEDAAVYELWLRGLWRDAGELSEREARFLSITRGLLEWARQRVAYYMRLEAEVDGRRQPFPADAIARNPLTARAGVKEFFWLARLLCAEVSSIGRARYLRASWLELVAVREEYDGEKGRAARAREAERVLRAVFDYAGDLVQNAVEVTETREARACAPELSPPPDSSALGWREAFDRELKEIEMQNAERTFSAGGMPFHLNGVRDAHGGWWSRRILAGHYPSNDVVGLAFSGGGIRSATFGLGVLEGLQEFDVLKHVDYLSTVSGGGFIGSWLLGNVLRNSHWLGRQTNWEDSIGHLRRYSKYLAPQTGILSADWWTMWGIWLRNALLVQLTAVAWVLGMLCASLLVRPVFDHLGDNGIAPLAQIALALTLVWIGATAAGNLRKPREGCRVVADTDGQVRNRLVFPALFGAFVGSALLWAQAKGSGPKGTGYAAILRSEWHASWMILIIFVLGLGGLGWITEQKERDSIWKFLFTAAWAAISTAVFYLEICAVTWMFRTWGGDEAWYALVFGPSLILTCTTVAVVIFIGLTGRSSYESTREWWTRLGSWLGIYGAGYLLIATSAVLGPYWILALFSVQYWEIPWATVAGVAGTVLSGVVAGKSSKTTGARSGFSEYLAKAGAVLFIAGGLLSLSTLLYLFLLNNAVAEPEPASRIYFARLADIGEHHLYVFMTAFILLGIGLLLSWRIELNVFSLNSFYRNRLVRCYLGATRWRPGMRRPNPFTGFDGQDDIPLNELRYDGPAEHCGRKFRGPLPIINCTLNLGGSGDLNIETRKSTSFSMTPVNCGADRPHVGYAPTEKFAGEVKLGQAVAVSGAAVSPNMGYSTSSLVSFLLTMFNVRLGRWFPNPSKNHWQSQGMPILGFSYLIAELLGMADETSSFINVSDGGHFENLAIYELIRRRTKVIIASDGECDEDLQFGSLGNLVRICETDFGAIIEIDVSSIRKQEKGLSHAHCAVGKITYSNGSTGWLIYLKASITGDEDVGVAQYRSVHPSFPHESTADQFFAEDQFESYRRLGRHTVHHCFRGTESETRLTSVAERLFDTWTPASFKTDSFLKHTAALGLIWDRFRGVGAPLANLFEELTGTAAPGPVNAGVTIANDELSACLELMQLMEDVFVDLHLDDFWTHPDNRGWGMLFRSWARSPRFQQAWRQSRRLFGIRFEYFCEEHLGLPRERPVVRVEKI